MNFSLAWTELAAITTVLMVVGGAVLAIATQLLRRTFVARDLFGDLEARVADIETILKRLPTRDDFHLLGRRLEGVESHIGSIREGQAGVAHGVEAVKNIMNLLLRHQLGGERHEPF